MNTLAEITARTHQIAQRYQGKGLTEQDTKNALIEPVLAALGWPKSDLERVRAEYRQTSKSNPVDYALLNNDRPVLFVEAKALDKSIEEHKFIAQVLSYANVAGVDWALITNGLQWDLYSVFARVQARQKRFFSTTLDDPDFKTWMQWITPARLEGNELERFWRLVVAERQVRETLIRLFGERNDALLSLLAKEATLDIADVAMALQSLQPSFGKATLQGLNQVVAAIDTPLSPRKEPEPAEEEAQTSPKSPKPTRSKSRKSSRTAALPKPPRGTRPITMTVGEMSYPVQSWRDMLLAAVGHVHGLSSERYDELFDAPEFKGQKRRYFCRSQEGMTTPAEVPGGYLEVNQSAEMIVRFIGRLMAFFEIPIEQVHYETAPR